MLVQLEKIGNLQGLKLKLVSSCLLLSIKEKVIAKCKICQLPDSTRAETQIRASFN